MVPCLFGTGRLRDTRRTGTNWPSSVRCSRRIREAVDGLNGLQGLIAGGRLRSARQLAGSASDAPLSIRTLPDQARKSDIVRVTVLRLTVMAVLRRHRPAATNRIAAMPDAFADNTRMRFRNCREKCCRRRNQQDQ